MSIQNDLPDTLVKKSHSRAIRLIKSARKPILLSLLSSILAVYLYLFKMQTHPWFYKGAAVLLIFSSFWLAFSLINTLIHELRCWGELREKSNIINLLSPLISNALKLFVAWILLNLILPFLSLSFEQVELTRKVINIFLIAVTAWFLLKFTHIFEQFMLKHLSSKIKEDLKYRKIHTQVMVLKRISVAFIIFLALVMMLMTSDRVRELGATLLASAGIIAAIVTFAAQKTLTGVVSGIQIALTQPIHLNDVVLVENELGQIEEISLSYVVIRLQDKRRLIVPINYFIEKPFQNFTRNATDLLGNVSLYVDYSISTEKLRDQFQEILTQSSYWNKKAGEMNIVDAKPNQMELRFSMSAQDSKKLWKLRCEVLEKLINYVKENYPKALGIQQSIK